ncbi:MAG: transposase [Chitinispirillaceae bacterium]
MSTKPRVVVPHVYYQIRSEACTDVNLFPSEEQTGFFLHLLECKLKEASYICIEKSLQQDHYHLVVKVSQISISWFMRTLNSIYAKYLNTQCRRKGKVFARRFASALIDRNAGLEEVSCHVHLNTMLHAAARIPSGKKLPDPPLVPTDPEHTRYYRDYYSRNMYTCHYTEKIRKLQTANRIGHRYKNPQTCIIGNAPFVVEKIGLHLERVERYHRNGERIPPECLKSLRQRLSALSSFENVNIMRRGRENDRSKARELIVLIGVFMLEFSGADLARFLGIKRSSVSRMITKRIGGANRSQRLRKEMEALF